MSNSGTVEAKGVGQAHPRMEAVVKEEDADADAKGVGQARRWMEEVGADANAKGVGKARPGWKR